MFLALAQGWIDAAERLEQNMGLKRAAGGGLETQTAEREMTSPSFNHISAGEMLWTTESSGQHSDARRNR